MENGKQTRTFELPALLYLADAAVCVLFRLKNR